MLCKHSVIALECFGSILELLWDASDLTWNFFGILWIFIESALECSVGALDLL